jgi:hypothetical protein
MMKRIVFYGGCGGLPCLSSTLSSPQPEEDVEGELPSFDQYALFPADEPYRNLADQVISELWVSLSRSTALISLLSLDILEIK